MRDDHIDHTTFALGYGVLEELLADLLDARSNVIISRFRKLRPKFAADGLLTRTGNRVSYDLTRVLAICAIYQLNSLSIPQGYAVDLVVANWPEVARAYLNAWVDHKAAVDSDDGCPIHFFVDAINLDPANGSWASAYGLQHCGLPRVSVECRAIVDVVTAHATLAGLGGPALEAAFSDLDRSFGKELTAEGDSPRLPARLDSGFFGTGPYFDRARALLFVESKRQLRGKMRPRLQSYLDYLERPAPIDGWKRFIGTEPQAPRLVHMLAAWGRELGLDSRILGKVETLKDASTNREAALVLIQQGEEHLEQLARGVRG